MSSSVSGYVLFSWILLAVAVFISLFLVNAPYGRYFNGRAGLSMNGRLGWIIMEAPAPIIFATCFLTGFQTATIPQIIFLIMWESHYIDRSFIYPITLRISSKPLPITVLAAGFIFNVMNAYLNGSYIVINTPRYLENWLYDIRFLTGLAIFILGFFVNRYSDLILYRIRRMTLTEYAVPCGGFFHWVSCPNYLGEILIWIGWTIATWSPVAAAFALWTAANLAPRAHSHHKWYLDHFDDYPSKRKALLPGIW